MKALPASTRSMNKKQKTVLAVSFVSTMVLSFFSLGPAARSGGGPCNAGIVFLFLGAALIFVGLVQFAVVLHLLIFENKDNQAWTAVSFAATMLLIGSMILFGDEAAEMLYMIPFLMVNICISSLEIKNKHRLEDSAPTKSQ